MTFKLLPTEIQKLEEWFKTKNLNKYQGAGGGRFTYHFTPMSVGMVVTVSDSLEQKDTIDITDYYAW